MFAVIHRVAGSEGAGLLDVAGQPLLVRQLQWLRALGIDRVAVELSGDAASVELSRVLADHRALAHGVVEVLSSRPLGPREVARRAGLEGPIMLGLGQDVLCTGDVLRLLPRTRGSTHVRFAVPAALEGRVSGAELELWREGEAPAGWIAGPGFGVTVASAADALALTRAALSGALPGAGGDSVQGIEVHATESEPGIWLGRGVLVEHGARLEPPVLIGAGAIVRSGAVLSGGSVIGAGAAIDRGARVHASWVAADSVVGENVVLDGVVARGSEMLDVETGELLAQLDPLLLAPARRERRAGLVARCIAVLVLPLLPVVFLAARVGVGAAAKAVSLWCALWRGERTLVGVGADESVAHSTGSAAANGQVASGLRAAADRAPRGIVNIESMLVPPGATLDDRLRARAWYAVAKAPRLDVALVGRTLAARVSRLFRFETSETVGAVTHHERAT